MFIYIEFKSPNLKGKNESYTKIMYKNNFLHLIKHS